MKKGLRLATVLMCSGLLTLGSAALGASWEEKNNGLFAGDVRSLVADTLSPSIFYAGTCTGVFRSTDGGGSWTKISEGFTIHDVTSLALAPGESNTIYAGTEDGLYKTTDAGGSWLDISFALPNRSIVTLISDPGSPGTLYTSLGFAEEVGRVFKTIDGGNSWSSTLLGGNVAVSVLSIAVDPNDPAVVYAGAGSAQLGHGVYLSQDGGSSWNVMNSGLSGTVYVVATDPVTSGIAYAATNEGVFKTASGGSSWSQLLGQGNFGAFLALAVAPSDPNTLYTGGEISSSQTLQAYRSTDGGQTWTSLQNTPPFNSTQTIAIDPANPMNVLFGFQGAGVYQVDSSGGALVSSSFGLTGLPVDFLGSGVSSVSGNTTFYAGSAGNGVYATADHGETWSLMNNGLGNNLKVRAIAVAPEAAEVAYLATWGGLFKTTDHGQNWNFLSITPNPEITKMDAVTLDPADSAVVYASGRTPTNSDQGIFKSLDGGCSWARLSYPFGVSFLQVSSADPNVLYAINVVGFLYKSEDGGTNWSYANIGSTGGGFAINVALDPFNVDVAYFGYGNGLGSSIFKTVNGAHTWTRLNGAPSGNIKSLVIDPIDSSILYAAYVRSFAPNVFGVYKSTNGGASWFQAQDGIGSRDGTALVIDPQAHETVFSGTKCAGTFLTTTGGI